MAAIPADQLPAELRAQLGLPATTRRRPKPTTAGSAGWNLRCAACGHTPRSPAAADRHSADTGHHVWTYPLEEEPAVADS